MIYGTQIYGKVEMINFYIIAVDLYLRENNGIVLGLKVALQNN